MLLAVLLGGAPAASARQAAVELVWRNCGTPPASVQCATAALPLDYDRPRGDTLDVHVARVPASDPQRRLGALFLNFGGPGAPIAEDVERFGRDLFPALGARYDIVGVDPRGTGQTEGAIDCKVKQETHGVYAQPFATPFDADRIALQTRARRLVQRCLALNDRRVLAHVSTANTARDMDAVREALGDRRLNYLGFSYGTALGATYAALFPQRIGRMVLDGPVDVTGYLNEPSQNLFEQTAGFERALGRFFQACASDQAACSGFGGKDPWMAYDGMLERADASPLPAGSRPVDGDDIRFATVGRLYAKHLWGQLAYALARAERGDGTAIRALADALYERGSDGTYGPGLDRYFVLGAVEQRFGRGIADALRAGDRSWGLFDHFSMNAGYVQMLYALWPVRDRDAHRGPFRIPAGATTPLVVAVTYDPATPYNGARRLVRDLGNARLLTVRGDGHTAYGSAGPCADAAIEAYLLQGKLPAPGTVCAAEQPFERFQPRARAAVSRAVASPRRR